MLRHRLRAADPEDRGRRRLAREPRAAGRRRQQLRRVRGRARRPGGGRRGDPPGRPRPLPLLRGAGAALRRARIRGPRDRLLRPHGRHRAAGRRVRVPAARRADHRRGRPGGHPGGGRRAAPPRRRVDLHGRVLLRRARVVDRSGLRPRAGRSDRLLRQPDARARRAERRRARGRDDMPDPGAAGGRRREHRRGRQRRLRPRARRGRCRARDRHVRPAHRTVSSTASRRSSRKPRTMPGAARSASSTGSRDPRDRPGHDRDDVPRRRRRPRGGRPRLVRGAAALSAAGMGRARPGGDLGERRRRRAPRARRRRSRDSRARPRRDREPARDDGALGPAHRTSGRARDRLAGPPDGRALRRARSRPDP